MDYKLINPEYLHSVSGGDLETEKEIIEMFREQSEEIYKEFIAKLSEKNYTMLGQLAHKAKSSVAIMGMEDLAAVLKTFELQAKESKEPGKYEAYIKRFKSDTDSAVRELEDYLNI
ncbi:MAG TPA: Hpt domain-containing protein [Bacteroidales bacterium]|nr:Hpt domain-containing protein [Bacteroidales bacterium]